MKKQYQSPEIKGPIECMRGTIGFKWEDKPSSLRGTVVPPKIAFSESQVSGHTSLVIREEEFGGVIHNPITDAIYECNHSALFICNSLNGKNTIEDIANGLMEEFEVDIDVASKDVERFVNHEVYGL